METQSLENVFARSWQLLTRNWIIIVPGIVVGVIVGVITDLIAPPATYADPSTVAGSVAHGLAGAVAGIITGVIGLAGFVITQCYTVGMAGAAWERGTTALGDGASALRDDFSNVLGAAFGMFVLGVVAVILALPTLGISLVVFYLFMLYVIPSAVVGNQGGFAAIAESFAIARAKFGATLIIGIVLGVIGVLGGTVAVLFAFAPFLGPIVAAIITQVIVAFSSLVLVGEYRKLRGSGLPPPGY